VSIVPLATVCGSYIHFVAAALGLPLGIGLLQAVSVVILTSPALTDRPARLAINKSATFVNFLAASNGWMKNQIA
jgi:hypothetical protein